MQRTHSARKILRSSLAGEEVQQCVAQRIIHRTVQRMPQRIGAELPIGHFVAHVLPDLAQHGGVRVFRLDALAQGDDEIVRQFVRHVQSPAGGAAADPLRDHAVLVLNDEITVGGTVFLDLRQGLDAPPAIIFLREVLKAIPRSVGRILGLIRTYGIIQPIAVEIDAVVARMGEHAVQHHAPWLRAALHRRTKSSFVPKVGSTCV